ncbi:MAG: polyprenol monophosphomannose synthase [Dehalococcoidia bacterium]|nr:polyprenol monophosphomannose synthase [Dehalococcoidia bacterium]
MPKLSIIVPTYNERDNVSLQFQHIANAINDFEVIFVDDNSPDGTAQVIKELLSKDARVRLLQRPGKLGLGTAIMDGLKLARGEFVGMMDADHSHDATALPAMMNAFSTSDIIIGSRYVKGGKIVGWPFSRYIVSHVAILIAKILLNPSVKDTTSGFVLYRRQMLEALQGKLSTHGYKLLLEVLVKSPHARVKEIPITFVNRLKGKSKLNRDEIIEFIRLCWQLRRNRSGTS